MGARRHNDIAESNYAFYRGQSLLPFASCPIALPTSASSVPATLLILIHAGIGAEIGLTDPIFRKRLAEHSLNPDKLEDMPKIGELWIDQVWHGRLLPHLSFPDCIDSCIVGKAHTWEKVPKYVPLPPFLPPHYSPDPADAAQTRKEMENPLKRPPLPP